MKGNFHVQFLGEGVAATSPPYPTLGWATTQVYPAQFPIPNSRPPSGKDLLGGDPADLLPVDHDRYLVAPVIHSRRLISTRGDRTGIRLDHTVNQVDDPVPRNPAPRVGGQLLTRSVGRLESATSTIRPISWGPGWRPL